MKNECIKFMTTMYEGLNEGYVPVLDLPPKETKFYKLGEWDVLTEDVERRVKEERSVYFSVCPLAHPPENGRGTEADVGAVTALFADIDIADGVHKKKNYPETVEKALELMAPFPKSSILIHSGGGLHAYWLLDKPFIIQNEDDRAAAKKLLAGFQNAIIKEFNARGYEMDHTADLARVLRVPGTVNFKDPDNPKEVRIISFEEPVARYAPEQFPQVEGVSKTKTMSAEADSNGLVEGDVNVIARRCRFIQHCIKNAANLDEPSWYTMITNLSRIKDSDQYVHEISSPYLNYSPEETQQKINHAREENKPCSCMFVQTKLGFKGCPLGGCPVEKPLSWLFPKGLAYDKIMWLLEQERLTQDEVWNEETQDAFAEIRLDSEARFQTLINKVREKVRNFGIRDYKRAIEDRRQRKAHRVFETAERDLAMLSEELGYDVTLPQNYYIDGTGQINLCTQMRTEIVALQPMGIASQYVNRNGETLDELVFQRQGINKEWIRLLVQPQNLASMHKIIDFSNFGLLVDTTKSSLLSNFMTNFKKANGPSIPKVPFTSQLGWQVDGSFFPGLSNFRFIHEGKVHDETEAFLPKGTLDDWTRIATPARGNAGARAAMDVSFAAPLLKLINYRTFILHLWGPSRGGKTAAQHLAASVWLKPSKALISFNATKVGLERQLGFFANVPVFVDERQVVGENQSFLDTLVYMMGEGVGRVRGMKLGGVQQGEKWNTIVVTSGEHPLSSQTSAGGVKTRSLEPFFTKVIEDAAYASSLYSACNECYGTAGPVFLAKVLENMDGLNASLKYWTELLGQQHGNMNAVHRVYLSVIAAADFLASQYIWGLDEEAASADTKGFLEALIQAVEVTEETEELFRVSAFVEAWLAQNENRFSELREEHHLHPMAVTGERFGWYLPGGNVGIIPTAFIKALREMGFNWDRVKRDFAKQGWLRTVKDGGSISYTIPRTIPDHGPIRLVELIGFRAKNEQTPMTEAPITFQENGDELKPA